MNVVGSLKEHINAWRRINTNEEVIDWINNGLNLPLSFHLTKFSPQQVDFIDSEIWTLFFSGAISESVVKPFCVNAIGCVPKKTTINCRLASS